MSHIHAEPGAGAAQASPTRNFHIVPAIPHIDRRTDTAPPWTVPSPPANDLDPHLDIASPDNITAASGKRQSRRVSDLRGRATAPPRLPEPPTTPAAA